MASGVNLSNLHRRIENIERRKPRLDLFPNLEIEFRGANKEIQSDTTKEILLVGSAGTGKTTAILKKIYDVCLANPYVRVALVRKTRASLNETTLVTFEQHILGYGHPLLSGSNRANRLSYVFPNNSRINLVGMDKPDRVLSADYDIIYICESQELDESDMEALMSRLRNGKLTYHQLLMDCNPQSKSHWLWQRHEKGTLKLITSYHQDNPKFFDIDKNEWTAAGSDYMSMLGNLSGVRYKRLFKGEWCSAEGAVYEFDRTRHTIKGKLPEMIRYVAGVDWGHKDAGAMVLVGQDREDKLYVVEECMRTAQTLDFWESKAQDWMNRYGYIQFMCDPSIGAHIQSFVIHGIPAMKAVNKIEVGIDMVQRRFSTGTLQIHTHSMRMADPVLQSKRQPINLVEEIEGYVWNEKKDMPKDGNNHSLDALRYAVVQYDKPMFLTNPVTSTSNRMSAPPIPSRYRTKKGFPNRKYSTTNR